MSADFTWSLSGVDTRRWRIRSGSMWRPPVSVRSRSLVVPGQHGVVRAGLPVFDEPRITLELRPEGVDEAGLEAAQAELVALLTAPGLTVTRSSGGVTASAPARLETASPGRMVPGSSAAIVATLTVPGVFLRGEHAVDDLGVLAASPVTLEVPGLAASTGPVTDALLRVTGPATSLAVVDEVTGTGVSWSGAALTAGRYLFVDVARMVARWSTSPAAWDAAGTDVSGGLDYPGAGPLQLWPRMRADDPADRAVTVTVTGGGYAAATALAIRARPAYL